MKGSYFYRIILDGKIFIGSIPIFATMLTEEEIKNHKLLKVKFPTYPQLPKHILLRGTPGYRKPNQGLIDSTTRGFLDRVSNWNKAEEMRWDV